MAEGGKQDDSCTSPAAKSSVLGTDAVRLLTKTELLDDFLVVALVGTAQVPQESVPLTHHENQTTP